MRQELVLIPSKFKFKNSHIAYLSKVAYLFKMISRNSNGYIMSNIKF